MHYTCPKCQSDQIAAHDYAKKVGGVIGILVGIASGIAGTFAVSKSVLKWG